VVPMLNATEARVLAEAIEAELTLEVVIGPRR
jgi:hypothetical protein